MLTINYQVVTIDGDYAILKDENNNTISIARALLPLEIGKDSKLLFENFEYSIIE
ncbi:chorismate--pyruvate lyase [Clostridium subterminale]|uniref:Chorismate--pyruvate lyase n=1 Tax=Clostridium subterminale TaxID=1550 RepID=A0ABN1KTV5_CLOSU